MKTGLLYSWLTCVVVLATLAGCGGGGNSDSAVPDAARPEAMVVTASDTAALRSLAVEYLNHLRNREFAAATAMLHEYDKTTGVTGVLSDSAARRIDVIHNTFPVVDYSIDDIRIVSENNTEIRYTIEMFESPAVGSAPNTMRFVLTPKRVDGVWLLCVDSRFDTQNGD